MHFRFLAIACAMLSFSLHAANAEPAAEKPAPLPETIDFNRDVRPIISANCFQCHGPDKAARKAKLRLDTREGALADLAGSHAIVPGSPDKSGLYTRTISKDPEEYMPPPKSGHSVTPNQIAILKRWIEQGAVYAEHWSFSKPQRAPLPAVKKGDWARNSIDTFVLARLEKEGLTPSPPADRYALIRRAALDLTGIPPSPADVDAFVNDKSPDAFEKAVDKLLASPAYGERWARMWLDLARFADSAGYGSDPLRPNLWPFRDWVIDAFNKNMPYDQFTTEQIAGDLLPNATQSQILGSAFHRNTMTNSEGGTDDEEFRVAAVKDRANTTGQVWMGLTVGCAQCHSHKYDPISQKEYYQFFALFNQTEDADRQDESPTMPMPTPSQQKDIDALKAEIAAAEAKLKSPTPEFTKELTEWEKKSTGGVVTWEPLDPIDLKSQNGMKLEKQADKSIFASSDKVVDKDAYTIAVTSPVKEISAIRIEALPHEKLPGKGPGYADGNGNFVLNEVSMRLVPEKPTPVKARFVRIELPGKEKFLHIAEVQVFSAGQNIATKGKATQSSTDYDGPPEHAIDGNTNGDYNAKSVTHTKQSENPWWEVDLTGKDAVDIDQVVLWNRTDGATQNRMNGVKILVLDAARNPVWQTALAEAPQTSSKQDLTGAREISLKNASATFNQDKFTANLVVDAKTDKNSGWAVAGGTNKPQSIALEVNPPLKLKEGETARLEIKLSQNFGSHHTLGSFRLSATNHAQPVTLLPDKIAEIIAVATEKRTAQQAEELADYFRPMSKSIEPQRKELAALNKKLEGMKPPAVPIMRELAAGKQRKTHLLNKGNFLTPGEEVQAALPTSFNKAPAGAPMNRLGIAQWLLDKENPLTARVAVNRFWAQIFGVGIVESEEDFGTQGTLPTHPELLDWMALEFMDKKWDVKGLLKSIVTSATYQQSSRVTAELLEKDPRDRLLSRYPRRRLEAEMIRDQALTLSGLLSHKIGGPSVYPPQPDGLWRAAFNGERTWSTSMGEDRYRRGLYTFWRRTVPYPSMATFDAPSREICTVRRISTNTPLQAFVTMNDPVYVECAQSLGRRLIKEGGASPEERARYGLRLALARQPSDAQVASLVALYKGEFERYQKDPAAAKKMASDPLGPLPAGVSDAEAAAWSVVGNVLLNLDGVLTKG